MRSARTAEGHDWFERQRRPKPESVDDPPLAQAGDIRSYVTLSGPRVGEVLRVHWIPTTSREPGHWVAVIVFTNNSGTRWGMGVPAWHLEPGERC